MDKTQVEQFTVDIGCAGARRVAVGVLLRVSWAVLDTPRRLGSMEKAVRQHFRTALISKLGPAGADTWSCLLGQCTTKQQAA